MMTADKKNSQVPDKGDGIINEQIIKAVADATKLDNAPAVWGMIKILEPDFYKEVIKATNETKTYFRGLGVSGEALDKIGDVVTTYYIKGFMTHREGINKHQANVLDELYKRDYDAFCDDLIAQGLKAMKKKNKGKKKSIIQSIEPVRENKLADLISDEDIADGKPEDKKRT